MTFPRSDHFNGKTFFYPGVRAERGLLDVLKWKLTSRAARWPSQVELIPSPPPPAPAANEIVATWLGHATFLLQTAHGNFLTDPVFSDRVSPVTWAGPRRVHPPGLAFEALPRIDGVLLSHDHYDHCDLPSLRRLAATHRPLVLAPLGHGSLLRGAGIDRVEEMDWWQTRSWAPLLEITLTPSVHWTRRRLGGTNQRLWGGFYLRTTNAHRVYFLGDSSYHEPLFAEIRERCGEPDLALIPIGAYEPRWFMKTAHMNPEEAVQVHRVIGARRSIAMHWGTWQLTDEAREEPPLALARARAQAGVAADEFVVLHPGETIAI